MRKTDFLKSQVNSKVLWVGIIIFLLGTSVIFYILKEMELNLRISTQEQLIKTVEEKNTVTKKLFWTISAKREIEEELKERERQLELALDRVEQEIAARRQAEARLIIALEENNLLRTQIRDYAGLPEGIELEEIVIVKAIPVLDGKILSVNKEHGFVVVNLGRANDIKLGEILSVYRGNTFIGSIRVEKIKEEACAGSILPAWRKIEFREDDEVKKI